ncbi:MAG: rhodanese-like domain-containing protein [Pseudomonadota bacterium]
MGEIPDIEPGEAYRRLQSDAVAQLIDVRTPAEWTFAGHPDLGALGKSAVLAQWSSYPDNAVDTQFADRLSRALSDAGLGKETPLFFLCRSGVRSLAAANAMAAEGFTNCHNVADGFDGPLNEQRQRGHIAGWRASGLPWMQG